MLVLSLRTYLIASAVAASGFIGQKITPETYTITRKDIKIHVELNQLSAGKAGVYRKHSSAPTSVESSFYYEIEKDCGYQWVMMGQWKSKRKHLGMSTYLLVFNHKNQHQDAAKPQRWVLASNWFERLRNPGDLPHIERHLTLDTGAPHYEDALITFSILERDDESHASNSARESDSEESVACFMDTAPHIWQRVDSMDSLRRVRSTGDLYCNLQSTGDLYCNLRRWELSEQIPSQNAQIQKLEDTIEAQNESQSALEKERDHMIEAVRTQMGEISDLQWEIQALRMSLGSAEVERDQMKEMVSDQKQIEMRWINELQRENDEVREALVLAQQTTTTLQKIVNEKSSEIVQLNAKIEGNQQSLNQLEKVLEERDKLLVSLKEQQDEQEETNAALQRSENNVVVVLCSGGAVLTVVFILWAVIHYKSLSATSQKAERAHREQRAMLLKANEALPVMPSHADRLGVNEHPAVRDQFGMKEVFNVTAGEGKDLVRIARPLETAGAERKLSEELMNIQPMIAASSEGVQSTVTQS